MPSVSRLKSELSPRATYPATGGLSGIVSRNPPRLTFRLSTDVDRQTEAGILSKS